MPALVILIDEYAELPGEATSYTDSIARRGRAPAVTLLAATQRPTQKAMGQGSVRSQMDVRICFRVRERRDVDLILGQGMLTAGWDAHKLNAPGKFLISAPEHDTPRRARAYLLTDDTVAATATHYADRRPSLDPTSAAAIGTRTTPTGESDSAPVATPPASPRREDPEAVLWEVLQAAPSGGATVADLMQATDMGRSWVYYRLADLATAGRAIQVTRGCWRAAPANGQS
jgi:DNA segregation ATPase FtsK/SpoIIIE-like protein